ncbi:MAG: GntR family transcriptional regulator [Granulosicoccus sp.]
MTKMQLKRNTDTQTERGLRELRSRLIAGHWPAATKLREVPLAESFGISRTPLRAALLRLEQEGLLERSGGGYSVRAFSLNDALIAIELRGVIEGTAARLAAERSLAAEELANVKGLVAAMENLIAGDNEEKLIAAYGEMNTAFHRELARLAGSDLIISEVERACRLPFAAPSAFSTSRDDMERFKTSLLIGQEQHKYLVQAIERREGARAEALAREHAHLAKTNVEVAVRDRAQGHGAAPQLALVRD